MWFEVMSKFDRKFGVFEIRPCILIGQFLVLSVLESQQVETVTCLWAARVSAHYQRTVMYRQAATMKKGVLC